MAIIGPADICIEVVSEERIARDHGEKFAEYEKAGVREYWIVDPLRDTCRFNRLNEAGVYIPVGPGQDGVRDAAATGTQARRGDSLAGAASQLFRDWAGRAGNGRAGVKLPLN